MNYDKFYDDYIEIITTTQRMSVNTKSAYKYDLIQFVHFFRHLENKKDILNGYLAFLNAKGYKTASIKRKIVSVSLFYDYLVKEKAARENPFKNVDLKLRRDKRLPRTINIPNIRKILLFLEKERSQSKTEYSLFATSRNLALFDLLITTGIRIGEASNIKLEDINFSERIILIHGKGKKERLIYVSSGNCWKNLDDYYCLRKEIVSDSTAFFINKHLYSLGTHSIDSLFRNIIKKLKLNKNITPHCLRHTFATNLLSNGGDIRTLQELLGHSSIATTEIYTHIDLKRKIKVLNKCNYRNKI